MNTSKMCHLQSQQPKKAGIGIHWKGEEFALKEGDTVIVKEGLYPEMTGKEVIIMSIQFTKLTGSGALLNVSGLAREIDSDWVLKAA